jgi:hypothetical protein
VSASRTIGSCPRRTAAKSFRPLSSFSPPAASASARALAALTLAASPLAKENRRTRRLEIAASDEGCGGAASASARALAACNLAASPLAKENRRTSFLGTAASAEGCGACDRVGGSSRVRSAGHEGADPDDAGLAVPQRTSPAVEARLSCSRARRRNRLSGVADSEAPVLEAA